MASGKSKSAAFPNGKRRIVQGRKLAPRALRKKGSSKFLDDYSKKQVKSVSGISKEEVKEQSKW